MEACAEHGVQMVILDRPNPHGHHMQGPMLEPEFKSFVGFVPVPMVHGLTLGEAALMACGEGWIEVPESWRPVVIPCQHWSHGDDCTLGIRPSPNLPTDRPLTSTPAFVCLNPRSSALAEAPTRHLSSWDIPRSPWENMCSRPPHSRCRPAPQTRGRPCKGQNLTSLPHMARRSLAHMDGRSRAFRSNRCGLGRTRGVKRNMVRWTGSSRPLLFSTNSPARTPSD